MPAMKVVHISTADLKGGAAVSAYRLHAGLRRIGTLSSMLVLHKSSRDETVLEFRPPMDVLARIKRRWRRGEIARAAKMYSGTRPSGFELFSDDRSPYGASLVAQLPPGEIVNLHWVASFLDFEGFWSVVPQQTPVVWTLHDMNAITGGCHYDMECRRYREVCGACPQLGSGHVEDLSSEIWKRKKALLDLVPSNRLRIVTPSRWLSGAARESPLFARFQVETIPYGLDLDVFAPRERQVAREVLGIPPEAKVVLFVAEVVDNQRKGFADLIEVLGRCSREVSGLWLLSVGHNAPVLSNGMRGSHLPYVSNERFLSLAYSAADVFVVPSQQDNLPNTVLEAMACGVPVVGFDVGGIPDMVRDGSTGRLVQLGDRLGLQRAITQVMAERGAWLHMSATCRNVAVAEYALEQQARRYQQLYCSLWDGMSHKPSTTHE